MIDFSFQTAKVKRDQLVVCSCWDLFDCDEVVFLCCSVFRFDCIFERRFLGIYKVFVLRLDDRCVVGTGIGRFQTIPFCCVGNRYGDVCAIKYDLFFSCADREAQKLTSIGLPCVILRA